MNPATPAPPGAVPRGSSPWRWVVVAWLAATVLVIGGTVAGLNWFITEVGVDHPIHIVIHGEEVVDGRLRRYYMLTDTGAGALRDEATKLAAASQQAIARLGTWTPSPALRGAWA